MTTLEAALSALAVAYLVLVIVGWFAGMPF